MIVRILFAVIAACLPTLNLLAHDGDHTDMAEWMIAVHHAALPFAAVVTAVAVVVIVRRFRNGSSRD